MEDGERFFDLEIENVLISEFKNVLFVQGWSRRPSVRRGNIQSPIIVSKYDALSFTKLNKIESLSFEF